MSAKDFFAGDVRIAHDDAGPHSALFVSERGVEFDDHHGAADYERLRILAGQAANPLFKQAGQFRGYGLRSDREAPKLM